MKKCKRIMTAQRYFDGELNAAERERFESHLAMCEVCRAYYAEAHVLKSVIAQKQRVAPPEDFAAKVLKKAADAGTARKNEFFWDTVGALSRRLVPVAALLCCILLMSAVITLRSISVSSYRTAQYVDTYYAYSLGTNEKAFLASEDEVAVGHLFKALKYNVSDETGKQ